MNREKPGIAGYFPAIHRNYLTLLDSQPDAEVGVFGSDILDDFRYVRKDIRAFTPEQAQRVIAGLGRSAQILSHDEFPRFGAAHSLLMPDDDISHALVERYAMKDVTFSPVFLRWDRLSVDINREVLPDRIVTPASEDVVIQVLAAEAEKSSNWWRSVGAVITTDDEIISLSHNSSLPTDYTSSIDSDPRITANRGEAIEKSIDIHAEAAAIANCAKQGIAIDNASIYVTTFPCPNCAKSIAASGIKYCYYIEGYATLDGESILRANNIELIKIDTELPPFPPERLREYPAS